MGACLRTRLVGAASPREQAGRSTSDLSKILQRVSNAVQPSMRARYPRFHLPPFNRSSHRSPFRSSFPTTARRPYARAGCSGGTWNHPCRCTGSAEWRGTCRGRCWWGGPRRRKTGPRVFVSHGTASRRIADSQISCMSCLVRARS